VIATYDTVRRAHSAARLAAMHDGATQAAPWVPEQTFGVGLAPPRRSGVPHRVTAPHQPARAPWRREPGGGGASWRARCAKVVRACTRPSWTHLRTLAPLPQRLHVRGPWRDWRARACAPWPAAAQAPRHAARSSAHAGAVGSCRRRRRVNVGGSAVPWSPPPPPPPRRASGSDHAPAGAAPRCHTDRVRTAVQAASVVVSGRRSARQAEATTTYDDSGREREVCASCGAAAGAVHARRRASAAHESKRRDAESREALGGGATNGARQRHTAAPRCRLRPAWPATFAADVRHSLQSEVLPPLTCSAPCCFRPAVRGRRADARARRGGDLCCAAADSWSLLGAS
jgi:hypothetical protein